MVDYHVHIDVVPTLDELLAISRTKGVKFGVVEHAGNPATQKYRGLISDDEQLKRYIGRLAGRPCFKGIQAEGRDWMERFSPEVVAQLDYVLTDALTFPERDGTLVRLWTPLVRITDKQDFMERYTDFHVKVVETEPVDILANPLFLPAAIQPEADALWTEARLQRIVRAAVRYRVAFEINSQYRLPPLRFLRMAKDAGAKFSFGSNIHGPGVGDISYGLEMAKELGLGERDYFLPAPAGKKPIQVRRR